MGESSTDYVRRVRQVGEDNADYVAALAAGDARAREQSRSAAHAGRLRAGNIAALADAGIEVTATGEDGELVVTLPHVKDEGDVRAEAERERAQLRRLARDGLTPEEADALDAKMRAAVPVLLRAIADDLERALSVRVPTADRSAATSEYASELRARLSSIRGKIDQDERELVTLTARRHDALMTGKPTDKIDGELEAAERALSRTRTSAAQLATEVDDADRQAGTEAAADAAAELAARVAAVEALAWPAYGLLGALADLETIAAGVRVRGGVASSVVAATGADGSLGRTPGWAPLRGQRNHASLVRRRWAVSTRPPVPAWWTAHGKVCRLGL